MSASDPNGFVRNPPSVIVKVQNTSQGNVNGKLGIVVQFNQDRARYLVHLTETQQTVALKPENLVKASMLEQAQAQYQQLTKDPQIKREITKYYNMAVSKLPPGVKPEHAAGGLLFLLLLMIYFVGFTRVIMAFSLVMLVGVLIGPDLVQSGGTPNWSLIAANFPGRCRSFIEDSVPMVKGKLTDQVAAGIVLVFILLTARMVFLPSKAAVPAATARSGANLAASSTSIEEAYRLGYEDGKGGEPFGTSKPYAANPIFDIDEDILMSPPVSQPWYSKIGIWQAFAVMNIGRTLFELGRDSHGVFSPPLLVANLKQADPMRLGLLGLSVYNLLKVFF